MTKAKKEVATWSLLRIVRDYYEGDPEGLASDLSIVVEGEQSLKEWAIELLEGAEETDEESAAA